MSPTDRPDCSGDSILPLSDLIMRLGAGVDRFDEAFSRGLAAQLDDAADRLEFPVIEDMGLSEVVATFSMAKTMRLVVTGTPPGEIGEATVAFAESDFAAVHVRLLAQARDNAYTFCTLDYAWAGRRAELLVSAGSIPAGQVVVVRALATFGRLAELRVQGLGLQASVSFSGVRWLNSPVDGD